MAATTAVGHGRDMGSGGGSGLNKKIEVKGELCGALGVLI
jgi:hypothetical protein